MDRNIPFDSLNKIIKDSIKELRYNGIPRQAVHFDWNDIDNIGSELMARLLGREITIEVERSDFYNWEFSVVSDKLISKTELETLYAVVEADEDEKEKNVLEDGFINSLSQSLSCSLILLLLPFESVTSHTDDNGIWFIGEYMEHRTYYKHKNHKVEILALFEAYRLLVNRKKENNPDHAIRICQAIIADVFGYKSRADWSEDIRLAGLIDYGYDVDYNEQYEKLHNTVREIKM